MAQALVDARRAGVGGVALGLLTFHFSTTEGDLMTPLGGATGPESTRLQVTQGVTCLGCGCLCDDIDVAMEGQRLQQARNACELGRSWFEEGIGTAQDCGAAIDGAVCSLEAAVAQAVAILKAARAPRIVGLSGATIEDQRAAVALADACRGSIDHGDSQKTLPLRLAMQRVGIVSATLGEVKNRADLVVYWGCDPVLTHPRHWERYAVEPRGRFVPGGRSDRRVIVCGTEAGATSQRADLFVRVAAEQQLATLAALRALVLGRPVRRAFQTHQKMADLLMTARYGAFFLGDALANGPAATAQMEAALTLVRDLNEPGKRRFVALTLGGVGNAAGAEAVLCWQAGAPCNVDFRQGFPRFLASGTRSDSDQADTLVAIGDGANDQPVPWATKTPIIRIGSEATRHAPTPGVAIDTARTGIDGGGTVLRCDGVMLPLRPMRPGSAPSARAILDMIRSRLDIS